MVQLSAFSHDELEIIVSLPLKAAICVSNVEDEDGEEDDELEIRAIENILNKFSKDEGSLPVIKEVSQAILKNKGRWGEWSEDSFNIEPACEKAIKTFQLRASNSEVRAYVGLVLELVYGVARAYGEFGLGEEKPKPGFMGFLKKVLGGEEGNEGQPMNVSAAEDDAISRISRVLKKYS